MLYGCQLAFEPSGNHWPYRDTVLCRMHLIRYKSRGWCGIRSCRSVCSCWIDIWNAVYGELRFDDVDKCLHNGSCGCLKDGEKYMHGISCRKAL